VGSVAALSVLSAIGCRQFRTTLVGSVAALSVLSVLSAIGCRQVKPTLLAPRARAVEPQFHQN
jgi:hypothetical protein